MNKFTYNQEQAAQVGAGQYVTKSGGYDFKIVRAQFSKSTNNQSEALEFDFEDRDGRANPAGLRELLKAQDFAEL